MNAAGELSIEVGWNGERIVDVALEFSRPQVVRLLLGKSASEVLDRVPRLYSICACAQTEAARAALEAAGCERVAAPHGEPAQRILVEAAQEHLWRLLRDWPAALGLPARDADFVHWYRQLVAVGRDGLPDAGLPDLLAFVEEVFGTGWQAVESFPALAGWARLDGGLAAGLLRRLQEEQEEKGQEEARPAPPRGVGWLTMEVPLAAVVDQLGGDDGEAWAARPRLGGAPAETGALARWREAPLVADGLKRHGRAQSVRLVARLLDLARVARRLAAPLAERERQGWGAASPGPERGEGTTRGMERRMEIDSLSPAPGVGIGRVDTARGVLVHRVRVERERVVQYAIVAPTAWNFHPGGAFAAGITGLAASEEAAVRAAVTRWALALDPCVPWRLEVGRA